MTILETARVVLFVHAHPDDESLSTGGLIATLTAQGKRVTVVTATRGERGEVVPGPLKRLEGTAELASWREGELARAMAALGVTDQRFLGAAGARVTGLPGRRYADSGMSWGADGRATASGDAGEDSLTMAKLEDVVADLAAVVDDIHPDLIVSYDEDGGYGHPDHVRMHQVSAIVARAAGIPLVLVTTGPGEGVVSLEIGERLGAKRAALAAHRTQLSVVGDRYVLSGGQWHDIESVEHYRRRD